MGVRMRSVIQRVPVSFISTVKTVNSGLSGRYFYFITTILPVSVARRNSRGDSASRKYAVHSSAVPAQWVRSGCFCSLSSSSIQYLLLSAVLRRYLSYVSYSSFTISKKYPKYRRNPPSINPFHILIDE